MAILVLFLTVQPQHMRDTPTTDRRHIVHRRATA